MDKHLAECLDFIPAPIAHAVEKGHVCGAPFVDFTNHAAAILSGFEVIAELLRIDQLRENCEDEEDRLMTARRKDALLGLISSASRSMIFRASEIVQWADERRKDQEASHE